MDRCIAGRELPQRGEKTAILDQMCEVKGRHRDHARKALRHAAAGATDTTQAAGNRSCATAPRSSPRCAKIWAAADGPTGKRLAPVIPLWATNPRRHGELTISVLA